MTSVPILHAPACGSVAGGDSWGGTITSGRNGHREEDAMTRKYISFEGVEQLADIERLAEMLNLSVKRAGHQLRCVCPVHGGDDRSLAISPSVRSRRGSMGVFFCQKAQSGGDRIG